LAAGNRSTGAAMKLAAYLLLVHTIVIVSGCSSQSQDRRPSKPPAPEYARGTDPLRDAGEIDHRIETLIHALDTRANTVPGNVKCSYVIVVGSAPTTEVSHRQYSRQKADRFVSYHVFYNSKDTGMSAATVVCMIKRSDWDSATPIMATVWNYERNDWSSIAGALNPAEWPDTSKQEAALREWLSPGVMSIPPGEDRNRAGHPTTAPPPRSR
jgi:hypothetical protein